MLTYVILILYVSSLMYLVTSLIIHLMFDKR